MSTTKKYGGILLKGTIAVSIANASSQVVGILLLPVFTLYLSPEEYGIISMVSLIITFFALLYNPGIMSASMRLYHSTESEVERKILIGSANIFFLIIPIIPIIICLFFGNEIFSFLFSDFNFYPFGLLAIILAFFIQPSRIWSTLMTLQYKVQKTAVLTAISVIIGLLVSLVLIVVFKMGAVGRVLGMLAPAIFLFIISIKTVSKFTEGKWSLQSLKKQLLFGLPLIIGLWAYQGLNFIGKFLLENLGTLEYVGLYSLGVTLASVPTILVLGFRQLWTPMFYENMNKGNQILISKLITYFTLTISLISLIFILFLKEVLILFINERYHLVIPIIGILVLSSFFNGLLTISNTLLSYKNKFGRISIYAAIATVFNLILNLVLIPILGILGASIALVVSYFVFYILGVISQRKTLKKFQSNSQAFVPVFLIILSTILTYIFSISFNNNFNILEVILKLFYFLIVIFIFTKIKLISKDDYLFVLNYVKFKLKFK